MYLSDKTVTKIQSHVLQEYPKEACGVIVKGDFVPLANISETPQTSFKFPMSSYAIIEHEVEAIIHSHCVTPETRKRFDIRTPSLKDRLCQKETNKLWGIVGTEGESVTDILWYPHIPSDEYIGRRFVPYVNDCFTIVQDYIRFSLHKEPPEYLIEFDWASRNNFSHLLEQFLSYPGFVEVEKISKLQNGDILIVNHELGAMAHFAIYDNGMILHQTEISCRVPFSHFEGNIVKMLRYVGKENDN